MVGYVHDVLGPPPPLLDLEENMPSGGWKFGNRWQIVEKLSRGEISRLKLIPCIRRDKTDLGKNWHTGRKQEKRNHPSLVPVRSAQVPVSVARSRKD